MDPMTVIIAYRRSYPSQRIGQATFNAVYSVWPAIADRARATRIDPFHRDDQTNAFIGFVYEELGKERMGSLA